MVITKTELYWQCPYCDKKHDNDSDANDCILDCADLDEPIEGETTTFECEYCKERYENEWEAEECEEEHIQKQDKYFFKYEIKINNEILMKAASHKYQTKLV